MTKAIGNKAQVTKSWSRIIPPCSCKVFCEKQKGTKCLLGTPRPKRPTTKQLKRVFDWLDTMGLKVYGPVIDTDGYELGNSGCQDYSLKHLLLRWKALQRAKEQIK